MIKTICNICYGEVVPSSGKYLCLSGCGHVAGFKKITREKIDNKDNGGLYN
jgi:hypothetical protein